jgi:hypothetical protein
VTITISGYKRNYQDIEACWAYNLVGGPDVKGVHAENPIKQILLEPLVELEQAPTFNGKLRIRLRLSAGVCKGSCLNLHAQAQKFYAQNMNCFPQFPKQ